MNKNTVLLRRKFKLILKKGIGKASNEQIGTFLKNIEDLGFTFSKSLLMVLKTYDIEELEKFYTSIVPQLKKMKGSHVNFDPMYPNFPKQVMEASDAELYINAILHYFGDYVGLRILPKYEKEERSPLFEKTELTVISLGENQDVYDICKELIASKTSISKSDKKDIKDLFSLYTNQIELLLPNKIYHKEILSYVSNLLNDIGRFELVTQYYKTATDVLRLITSMSDGDISLKEDCKFKKFTRKYRKIFLSMLENCSNIEEDMLRYINRWIRIGEILHPGEYKHRFPKAFEAFNKLRNEPSSIKTFNGKVELYLKNKELEKTTSLLSKRPGEFARRMDHIIRLTDTKTQADSIIRAFKDVCDSISTPVLLQVMTHFKHRNDKLKYRTVFPKGNVQKIKVLKNNLSIIGQTQCDAIVKMCEISLIKRFKELPEMGKVYVDSALKTYLVPFSQRSASKALKTIVRGSKIPFGNDKDTIRFFCWWKQAKESRVDIDLSAIAFKEDWSYHGHLSYTMLRGDFGCHSGDITSAPNGASEFIDINMNMAKKENIRYIMMNLYSFTHQSYKDLPECFAGFMLRDRVQSGEIYDPKTVQNKFDLTADSQVAIPMIIDVVDRKIIWTDISLSNNVNVSNNLEGNLTTTAFMGIAFENMRKTNLFDLYNLHVKARGELVSNKKDADLVLSTDFQIEDIMANYL